MLSPGKQQLWRVNAALLWYMEVMKERLTTLEYFITRFPDPKIAEWALGSVQFWVWMKELRHAFDKPLSQMSLPSKLSTQLLEFLLVVSIVMSLIDSPNGCDNQRCAMATSATLSEVPPMSQDSLLCHLEALLSCILQSSNGL